MTGIGHPSRRICTYPQSWLRYLEKTGAYLVGGAHYTEHPNTHLHNIAAKLNVPCYTYDNVSRPTTWYQLGYTLAKQGLLMTLGAGSSFAKGATWRQPSCVPCLTTPQKAQTKRAVMRAKFTFAARCHRSSGLSRSAASHAAFWPRALVSDALVGMLTRTAHLRGQRDLPDLRDAQVWARGRYHFCGLVGRTGS